MTKGHQHKPADCSHIYCGICIEKGRQEALSEVEKFIDKEYQCDPQGLYYKLKDKLKLKTTRPNGTKLVGGNLASADGLDYKDKPRLGENNLPKMYNEDKLLKLRKGEEKKE